MEKDLPNLSEEEWIAYANDVADSFIDEYLEGYNNIVIVQFTKILYNRAKFRLKEKLRIKTFI
jgi:hypothetical protein